MYYFYFTTCRTCFCSLRVYGFKPDHSAWNSQLISGRGQVFFCEKSVDPVVLCLQVGSFDIKKSPLIFAIVPVLFIQPFLGCYFTADLQQCLLESFSPPPLPHCSLNQRCRSSDVDVSTGAGSPCSLDLCIVFVFFLALVRYGGHTYMRM